MHSFDSLRFVLGITFLGAAAGCSVPATEAAAQESEVASAASSCTTGCTNGGEFELRVTGSGFVYRPETGQIVAASAVESPGAAEPAVLLVSRVDADGTFDLRCPKALTTTFDYPSVGVWLDSDGDGKCGGNDRVLEDQRYGWSGAETIALTPSDDDSLGRRWAKATETSWDGRPFCEYYGFPR